jgi:hypothetical protein
MDTKIITAVLFCFMIASMKKDGDGAGRYWFLILFLVAMCAAYYALLYLQH